MISKAITSFNAGELSPWLDGRVDVAKYKNGCRVCENFIITPYGGVRRRPGTQYWFSLRDETEVGRLLPFRFSTSDTYILVFNDGYLRIYSGGTTPALVGSEINTAVSTGATKPYLAADLFEIQYAQQNDVMYLVHPDYPVRKLTRTSAATFTLADVAWKWAPMQDQNVTEAVTVQAVSGSGTDRYDKDKVVTLTGVGTDWSADLVGTRMLLTEERPGGDYEVSLEIPTSPSAAQSGEIQIQGGWQLTISGFWSAGEIAVQKWDGSAWVDERIFVSNNENRALVASGSTDEVTRMRIDRDASAASTAGAQAVLEATGPDPFGEVEITAWASTTSMTATVKHRLYLSPQIASYPDSAATNATDLWQEGGFSDEAGYPSSTAFHEGRLVFGGTAIQAQTLWGSVSDDYENFRTGTNDDDSYRHTLAAQEHNGIRWLVSERRLIIGTSGGEFVVGSSDDSVIVTPSNVRARRHSNFGSAKVQAAFVNDSVIYVQRNKHKLREYGYSFERDRYQATDLTVLAEHITGTGVTELAYQSQRDSILWGVTEEGDLIGLTYERDQDVVGWHRHTTGSSDNFESVETIYGGGEEDEVWFIVERTVAGATHRFIERFEPMQYRTMEDEDRDDYWYVDCAEQATGSDLASITLAHLPSTTVRVIGDGIQQADKASSITGVVTVETAADKITAGLAMTSRLEPMKLNVPMQSGTSRSREGRVNRLGINLWKSVGGEFGETAIGTYSGLDLDPITYRAQNDDLDSGPSIFTGEIELDCDFDYTAEGTTVGIVTDTVYPLAVLMLVPKVQFFGDGGGA